MSKTIVLEGFPAELHKQVKIKAAMDGKKISEVYADAVTGVSVTGFTNYTPQDRLIKVNLKGIPIEAHNRMKAHAISWDKKIPLAYADAVSAYVCS